MKSPQVAPPSARAVRAPGSTRTPRMPRQVDDDAVVAGAEAGHAVAAAAHGEVEAVLAGEVDRRHDVAGVCRSTMTAGPPVDHRVVDRARLVVAVVAGRDHLAAHALAQLFDGESAHRSSHPRIAPQTADAGDLLRFPVR